MYDTRVIFYNKQARSSDRLAARRPSALWDETKHTRLLARPPAGSGGGCARTLHVGLLRAATPPPHHRRRALETHCCSFACVGCLCEPPPRKLDPLRRSFFFLPGFYQKRVDFYPKLKQKSLDASGIIEPAPEYVKLQIRAVKRRA